MKDNEEIMKRCKVEPKELPSLEELYGISIERYCKIQNTTIDNLISKIERDIMILRENYRKYESIKQSLNDKDLEVVFAINAQIDSKEQQLKRLNKYTKGN